MEARIDHLVFYSTDLAAGEAFFESGLGSKPAFGGVHAGEGTCNSLVSLGSETYIEILARDPQQADGSLDPELRGLTRAGLYHWAVSGIDLAAAVAAGRASGLKMSDMVSGGRELPEGGRVSWRLAAVREHGFGALVPFFIDWTGSSHPGATAPRGGRLRTFTVFTPRAPELRHLYEAIGLGWLQVEEREEAGVEAEITGQRGTVLLQSIRPLPRGFLI